MTRGVWGEYGRMEGTAQILGTALAEGALREQGTDSVEMKATLAG